MKSETQAQSNSLSGGTSTQPDGEKGENWLQEVPENSRRLGSTTDNTTARDSRLDIMRDTPELKSRPPLEPRSQVQDPSSEPL